MIHVSASGARIRYAVRVEPGLLARAGATLRRFRRGGRLLVVTDRTVARLHGARFLASLRRAGFEVDVTSLPPGEGSKSPRVVQRICERWAQSGVDRGALVVAFGGGVVSDIAGFAAASYARGLDWVVFPTTVLAQADASIGGKVGVNLRAGKNLVGAFHHPRAVHSDPEVLSTLTDRARRSGLAEVAKMGVIRRPTLLIALRRLIGSPRPRVQSGALLTALIRRCAREKAWFVSRDPQDLGLRRHLNFGHTVGHALESAYGYGRYTHGEAVSIGMVAALRLSVRMAGLDSDAARSVEELLLGLGLPVSLGRAPGARFWRAISRDKKRGRKRLRMVLSPAIGAAKTYDLPSLTPLRHVISSLVRRP